MSGSNNGDVWSENFGFEEGGKTESRCYGNEVFTKYLLSDQGW